MVSKNLQIIFFRASQILGRRHKKLIKRRLGLSLSRSLLMLNVKSRRKNESSNNNLCFSAAYILNLLIKIPSSTQSKITSFRSSLNSTVQLMLYRSPLCTQSCLRVKTLSVCFTFGNFAIISRTTWKLLALRSRI